MNHCTSLMATARTETTRGPLPIQWVEWCHHMAKRFHLSMPLFVMPLAHSQWKSLVTWTDLSNGHIDEHAIKDSESATSV